MAHAVDAAQGYLFARPLPGEHWASSEFGADRLAYESAMADLAT